MNTILILLIATLLLGFWLTRPARAPRMNAYETALYNQLDSMERSFDATDRQFQKEQLQFRRQMRKSQNQAPPAPPKKPRAPRHKSPSLPAATPRESKPAPLPEPITIITPSPRITLFTACTQVFRTTASYAISLLRPLFQLPRTFTSFFTRPPTPKPTTTSEQASHHIAA